jgi:hypothetical protein
VGRHGAGRGDVGEDARPRELLEKVLSSPTSSSNSEKGLGRRGVGRSSNRASTGGVGRWRRCSSSAARSGSARASSPGAPGRVRPERLSWGEAAGGDARRSCGDPRLRPSAASETARVVENERRARVRARARRASPPPSGSRSAAGIVARVLFERMQGGGVSGQT